MYLVTSHHCYPTKMYVCKIDMCGLVDYLKLPLLTVNFHLAQDRTK